MLSEASDSCAVLATTGPCTLYASCPLFQHCAFCAQESTPPGLLPSSRSDLVEVTEILKTAGAAHRHFSDLLLPVTNSCKVLITALSGLTLPHTPVFISIQRNNRMQAKVDTQLQRIRYNVTYAGLSSAFVISILLMEIFTFHSSCQDIP